MSEQNPLDKIALDFSDKILLCIQELTHACIDNKSQAYDILNIVGNVLMAHILNIYSLTNGRDVTRLHFVEEMTSLSKDRLDIVDTKIATDKARDI